MESILFDLDGTLVDSSQGILSAFRYTFENLALPLPSDKELSTFIGPPLETTFSSFFDKKADINRAITIFRTYYNTKGVHQASVYEQIPDLLNDLQQSGKQLFVTTSKNEPMAYLMLKEQGLFHHFDAVYGALPERFHKSDVIQACLEQQQILKNTAVIIGDTKFDMIGGRAVGIHTLGITWGFGQEQDLKANGADWIGHNAKEVKKILES